MKFILMLLCLAGALNARPVAAKVAPPKRYSKPGLSVSLGTALKWLHSKGSVSTKLAADFSSGFVVAADGRGISRPDTLPKREGGYNYAGRDNHPYYRAGYVVPFRSTLDGYKVSEDGDELGDAVIVEDYAEPDPTDFYQTIQTQENTFIETLAFPETGYALSEDDDNNRAFWEQGVTSVPLDTAARRRAWLFGQSSVTAGAAPRDGVISPVAKRTIESSHSEDFELDRPAIELMLNVGFCLNPSLHFFFAGGYSFVFGNAIVDDSLDFVAPLGGAESLTTLGGSSMTVAQPIASQAFSKFGMATAIKTETKIKEGWKALVGFEFRPASKFIASFAVGTKEVTATTTWKGGEFMMPTSPSLVQSSLWDANGNCRHVMKFEKEREFSAKSYPLLWHVGMGVVVGQNHAFNLGFDYCMVNMTLSPTSTSASEKTNVNAASTVKKDAAESKFSNPISFSANDYDLNGNVHMSYVDEVLTRRSTSIKYWELSVALTYTYNF